MIESLYPPLEGGGGWFGGGGGGREEFIRRARGSPPPRHALRFADRVPTLPLQGRVKRALVCRRIAIRTKVA